MSSSIIHKAIESYQACVKTLSSSIGAAGVTWSDEQYQGLQQQVSSVANASRQVVENGYHLSEALARFEQIMSEG